MKLISLFALFFIAFVSQINGTPTQQYPKLTENQLKTIINEYNQLGNYKIKFPYCQK